MAVDSKQRPQNRSSNNNSHSSTSRDVNRGPNRSHHSNSTSNVKVGYHQDNDQGNSSKVVSSNPQVVANNHVDSKVLVSCSFVNPFSEFLNIVLEL